MFTFVVMVGETNSSKRQTERREKKKKIDLRHDQWKIKTIDNEHLIRLTTTSLTNTQ